MELQTESEKVLQLSSTDLTAVFLVKLCTLILHHECSLTQYEKSCGKHVKIYKYINKQLTYKILHILHLAICLNNELIEVFILLCKKCDVYLNKDKIEICL